MFDFERQLQSANTSKIVASETVERSLEQRQRDIYDSHRHRTFALAFYMSGNEITAETILTETFVRAFRIAEEPDAQMIDAVLIEQLRQQYPLDELDTVPASAAGSSLGAQNVRRTDLEEAIQYLPATERLIFLFHDVESYRPAMISEILNIPENQVQRACISARIRLRQALVQVKAQGREAA